MGKKMLVGLDNFKEAVEGYRYVDKTLLISEILETSSKVLAVARPRRFGKSLNMSILSYFFNMDNGAKNRDLFRGLDIEKSSWMKEQGKYPVINMTFKDVKSNSWEECYEDMVSLIRVEYGRHPYLKESQKLSEVEREMYGKIVAGDASRSDYKSSLKELSKYLSKYYGKGVIILIDEYDTPVIEGELGGYFKEASKFMEGFLGGALKGGDSLRKGIVTGITRLQGAGIFSGLNSAEVCTLFSNRYRDKFGFTEKEVKELLKEYDMEDKENEVRRHYNGYNFDGEVMYNPYSVARCIDSGRLENFWLGSSSNDLAKKKLKELMEMGGGRSAKKMVEDLLRGESLEVEVKGAIRISNVMRTTDILNLLLYSGYLKYENYGVRKNEDLMAEVSIPNREIRAMYRETIREWIEEKYTLEEIEGFKEFLNTVCEGGVDDMKEGIERYLESRSLIDVEKNEEMGYHNFFFGMFQGLRGEYDVKSNRESGEGRYDIGLMPMEGSKRDEGIVIEFKVGKKENLKDLSKDAISQIEEKGYHNSFKSEYVKRVRLIGIAFSKKSAEVTLKTISI